jgi:hypothetical protein
MSTNKNAIEMLDEVVDSLDTSIKNDDPLHVRDQRANPNDGYENYVTMAEAAVLDRFRAEKIRQRNSLVMLRDFIRRNEDDKPE